MEIPNKSIHEFFSNRQGRMGAALARIFNDPSQPENGRAGQHRVEALNDSARPYQ